MYGVTARSSRTCARWGSPRGHVKGRSSCRSLTNTTGTSGQCAPTISGTHRCEPSRSRPYGLKPESWLRGRVAQRAGSMSLAATAQEACGRPDHARDLAVVQSAGRFAGWMLGLFPWAPMVWPPARLWIGLGPMGGITLSPGIPQRFEWLYPANNALVGELRREDQG